MNAANDDATAPEEEANTGFLGVSATPRIVHGAVEHYFAERESASTSVGGSFALSTDRRQLWVAACR